MRSNRPPWTCRANELRPTAAFAAQLGGVYTSLRKTEAPSLTSKARRATSSSCHLREITIRESMDEGYAWSARQFGTWSKIAERQSITDRVLVERYGVGGI